METTNEKRTYLYVSAPVQNTTEYGRSLSNGYKKVIVEGGIMPFDLVEIGYDGNDIKITKSAMVAEENKEYPLILHVDEVGLMGRESSPFYSRLRFIFLDKDDMFVLVESGCISVRMNGEVAAVMVGAVDQRHLVKSSECWVSAERFRSYFKDCWDYECVADVYGYSRATEVRNGHHTVYTTVEVRLKSKEMIDLSLGWIEARNRKREEAQKERERKQALKAQQEKIAALNKAMTDSKPADDDDGGWSINTSDDDDDDDEGWTEVN